MTERFLILSHSIQELLRSILHLVELVITIKKNQETIIQEDRTAYQHIHRSLIEQGRSLERLEMILLSKDPPKTPSMQMIEWLLEVLPKIVKYWAPISAGAVAAYKWVWPYLRQLLGSS